MAGDIVKPKVYNCTGCGSPLNVSAAGYTTTVVCGACGAVLDANSPLMKIIGKFEAATNFKPLFEMGSFGTLQGIKWKLIGYVVRQDPKSQFTWEEYLLYNPYYGFRWLLNIDGHFSVTKRLPDVPFPASTKNLTKEFEYAGLDFKLFNSGRAEVIYVVGEFYWRVRRGEAVYMQDFISPPYMISVEIDKQESNFSVSEYIDGDLVKAAFKLAQSNQFVGKFGVAANQPNPNLFTKKNGMLVVMAVAALIAIRILTAGVRPEKGIISDTFTAAPKVTTPTQAWDGVATPPSSPQNSKTNITPSFEIPGDIGNLELEMSAPVNNQWAEANVTLVNENTGDDYTFDEGVEYYSGRDSDGAWSEGSQGTSRVISMVPGGKYHMEVEVSGDMPVPTATLGLVRNGGMGANFFIAFLLLILPPLLQYMRSRSFEISRWSNSDFSPYPETGGSDSDSGGGSDD